jgi:hypothetical protein
MVTTAAAFGQETTAERIDALEKRVRTLEAIIVQQSKPANIKPGGPSAASRATSLPEIEDKGQMLLQLTKWFASIKEGQSSTFYYVISYSLLNNYDKPVKAINGSIKFFDPDGADILELQVNRYAGIEPGREVSFKGFQAIDQSLLIRLTPKPTIGSVAVKTRCRHARRRLAARGSVISGFTARVPTLVS